MQILKVVVFSFSHQITGIVAVNFVLFPIIAFNHIKRSIENDKMVVHYFVHVLSSYCIK